MSVYTRSYEVGEVSHYINWQYFFHAWGFPARFGGIAKVHDCPACRMAYCNETFPMEERSRVSEALRLYEDAQKLLGEWTVRKLRTSFRVRLMVANSKGEDIVLPEEDTLLPMLRQQHPPEGAPCLCLADFLRPADSGVEDRIGLFVSTSPKEMVSGNIDDYISLLSQTLADRLAEATAELGHLHTRRKWWGFSPDENLGVDDLFNEKYQGKRPAVGYPSLPDQSLCFLLLRLLDFQSLGVSLTENGAMVPHASTCGLIFSHPATCHFSVGRVEDDQLADYAKRRGMKAELLRQFLP